MIYPFLIIHRIIHLLNKKYLYYILIILIMYALVRYIDDGIYYVCDIRRITASKSRGRNPMVKYEDGWSYAAEILCTNKNKNTLNIVKRNLMLNVPRIECVRFIGSNEAKNPANEINDSEESITSPDYLLEEFLHDAENEFNDYDDDSIVDPDYVPEELVNNAENEFNDYDDDSIVDPDYVPEELVNNAASPIGSVVRRTWTQEELHVAKTVFNDNIINGNLPSLNDCQNVIADNGELHSRSPMQLKLWISNQIAKKKKKTVSPPNRMTKVKISSQGEGNATNGNDFIERRRASLERYLKRTAQHPVLVLDPDFREFLESDIELPKATSTSALSSAGVMRLFNKVGETVNKITYKMDETDPWFEEKLAHVEGLETQLRKLHASVEAMVSYRKELAHLTNGVSRSAAMLSTCEDHNSLSRALSQLADTEEKVEALHLEQANTDFFILCELLKDYLGLLGAVRDAFHERTKLFQHWQHSQQMLAKKREAKAKLELSNRNDKLDQANAEVVEWESKVERGQENFDKISQMIKKEMDRFEKCRIQDFKVMFIKYLENHLDHQAQLVKYWEAFLPEAKAIA